MSETAEQIQTEAFSEHPSAEIVGKPVAPQTTEPELPPPDEADLTAKISELWRLHADYAASMRSQSQNLRSLRAELGKKLAEMKLVLARPGRNGQWTGWLREHKIPRATADRLVLQHERSLHPESSCVSEAISEPTEEEIQTLFDKLAPKLRKALPTSASLYRFLDLMTSAFDGVEREVTDKGIVIVNPANQITQSAVPESPSLGAQAENVPAITECMAQSNVEAVGIS